MSKQNVILLVIFHSRSGLRMRSFSHLFDSHFDTITVFGVCVFMCGRHLKGIAWDGIHEKEQNPSEREKNRTNALKMKAISFKCYKFSEKNDCFIADTVAAISMLGKMNWRIYIYSEHTDVVRIQTIFATLFRNSLLCHKMDFLIRLRTKYKKRYSNKVRSSLFHRMYFFSHIFSAIASEHPH